jgi:predicted nuclease of predicted toxin-antitoxin system
VWLEGLGQLKNPVTSLGTEPAIYWLETFNIQHHFLEIVFLSTLQQPTET